MPWPPSARSRPSVPRPALPHRLADLRDGRLRRVGLPPGRAARPAARGRPDPRTQPRRRFRHRLHERRRRHAGRGDRRGARRHRRGGVREARHPGADRRRRAGPLDRRPVHLDAVQVGTIKDVLVEASATRKYVSVDGGMSDNVRPALYAADYSVRIAGRASAADPALVRIAGKHCESGDIVVHADYLPGDVRPGDLLAVAATGAYCWSLASNYNYLGRPPVVAVRDGAARVIVRGETEADLLSRDAGDPRERTRLAKRSRYGRNRMIEYRNLRVALLGRRIGRRPGGLSPAASTVTSSPRGRAPVSSSSASRFATSMRRAPPTSPRSCSRPTPSRSSSARTSSSS